jgi:hypothetical protein
MYRDQSTMQAMVRGDKAGIIPLEGVGGRPVETETKEALSRNNVSSVKIFDSWDLSLVFNFP